jgi:dynein heavy chain
MFGGWVVEDNDKEVKTNTTNETYLVGVTERDVAFSKLECKGDIPLKRACHAACALSPDRMFLFGGYYDNKLRLNDVFFLQMTATEYIWKRAPNQPVIPDPPLDDSFADPTKTNVPTPRADTSCCVIGNKVYLFGGYGGVQFERKNYNDLYTYDIEKYEWARIECESKPLEITFYRRCT